MTQAVAEDRSLADWRAELRAWLGEHVPRTLPPLDGHAAAADYRAWERKLADAGYAAVHWPVEHGGRDAGERERLVFQEEYERAHGPVRINIQGLMLAGPTLMAFGTERQRRRWLPAMLRADEVWCQGFSEPDAGSDLASLRTRAVRSGDELVVNGQKIWTTGAHYSDWIFALVRTDNAGPKHRGITWVMIDLRAPGVTVRPIMQLNGRPEFAEIFFEDVRVPLDNVVGGIGNGWRVAMTALGFERGVGRRSYVQYLNRLERLRRVVASAGVRLDPAVELEFGDVLAQVLMYRDYTNRVAAEATSDPPTSTAAYNKLIWSELQVRLFQLGESVLRATGDLRDGAPTERAEEWMAEYWYSRAARIFAGTNQIQKNIIAERVLGMPR
ncbi:acyl-CoA dehydrogenase family protein [Streptomyces sp. NPDC007983]|uniref:acyl-CoA dehydrogenase family protein n=1 Tax=Streptomyces sp. NPDC007983 TaxID=3364800 RepID=UPI0036E1072E